MTPAEKIAASKPLRKCREVLNGSPRDYPWTCLVRHARLSLRLSLRDVAASVGMSIAGLSQVERGAETTLRTARKLAVFFGMRLEDLWPALRSTDE